MNRMVNGLLIYVFSLEKTKKSIVFMQKIQLTLRLLFNNFNLTLTILTNFKSIYESMKPFFFLQKVF